MASPQTSVSAFRNFFLATQEHAVTGPDVLLNELRGRSYLFPEMARNDGKLAVTEGAEISDTVQIEEFSNFSPYTPGSTRQASRGPTDLRIWAPWRFHENSRTVTEPEIKLNGGATKTRFKNLRKSIMQSLHTDHLNGLERMLWGVPDAANMESRSVQPGSMMSIPAFITESGRRAPGWTTTIFGIDPTVHARWQNQVVQYDSANPEDEAQGLFAAFDKIMIRLHFPQVPGYDKWFGSDDLRALKICTNQAGMNLFQRLLRSSNDSTRAGPQDPSYGAPQFKGHPLVYIEALDTALLHETGAVPGVSEGTYAGTAYPDNMPRFFFINCNRAKIWFEPDHLFNLVTKDGDSNQRDVQAFWLESWCNTLCRSRRSQGIVCPM